MKTSRKYVEVQCVCFQTLSDCSCFCQAVSDTPLLKSHSVPKDSFVAMFCTACHPNSNLTDFNKPNLFVLFLCFLFVGIACLCCIFTEDV